MATKMMDDPLKKKRKIRTKGLDGTDMDDHTDEIDRGEESDGRDDKKKELKKMDPKEKEQLTMPMAAMGMMFPMTMMMPMMLPFAQPGATDELPKKKKRGRPSKKMLAAAQQASAIQAQLSDAQLQVPVWPFGMPLLPVGFKFPVNNPSTPPVVMVAPNGKTKEDALAKSDALEDHDDDHHGRRSSITDGSISPDDKSKMPASLADELKKKVRNSTGKPRGRPRTRPRPGDMIARPKIINIAPAVNYEPLQGHIGHKSDDSDAKAESGDEDHDDHVGGLPHSKTDEVPVVV
ncbi:hypothetical protein SDRG_10267 [Saprolegnia diclina VS20]|uniref:Uncharacterized protein n=1 Tax=Saprolegnia diclina (strain VS20) TaxID=1156394 RepID=T0QER4_SAPDV|nr:hypothetical protein SDRG_10267 [Saprolegnia diclina VS20]EQC32070.1 hypothetical protein SDRG_10267 [Saprolegnia diclina VS20]|eukprot:XP_008614472.1 hypothetical protein SDRG_10267 [Saprolegnia diclina VS20]